MRGFLKSRFVIRDREPVHGVSLEALHLRLDDEAEYEIANTVDAGVQIQRGEERLKSIDLKRYLATPAALLLTFSEPQVPADVQLLCRTNEMFFTHEVCAQL